MREYEIVNLIGKKFGKWTVKYLSRIKNNRGSYWWICKCKCGLWKEVDGNSLRLGRSATCGCSIKVWLNTKKKYGRLTPVEPIIQRSPRGAVKWLFKCDCGKTSIHVGHQVKKGQIKSCGCGRMNKNPELAAFHVIYNDYKYGAKIRGYKFKIDFDFFVDLIKSPCFYCKLPFSRIYNYYRRKKERSFSRIEKRLNNLSINFILKINGVDRRNNKKDYTLKNTVPCCKFCNKAKYDLTESEFVKWLEFVRK